MVVMRLRELRLLMLVCPWRTWMLTNRRCGQVGYDLY